MNTIQLSQTVLVTASLKKQANTIARAAGYLRADQIIFGNRDCVPTHTDAGHRKHTTGEYVRFAYLRNFGRKDTYYQRAHTVVMLAI